MKVCILVVISTCVYCRYCIVFDTILLILSFVCGYSVTGMNNEMK